MLYHILECYLNNMKISYAITVCNEFVEIQKLISFILKNKRNEDEIIIHYDSKNGDPTI